MFIQLTDALAQMRQLDERGRPVPFTVEVTTCNEATGTGGDNLLLENWVLNQKAGRPSSTPGAGTRRVRRTPAEAAPRNEYADLMRTLRNPANDQLRQIHIRLITAFNGLIILW